MNSEDDKPKVPEENAPEVRTRTRADLGLGERSVTINLSRVTEREREEDRKWLPVYEEYADQRPKTRGDCVGGQRPCPWVSCLYNLYLDEKQSGSTSGQAIVLNFPELQPHEVPPDRSCALDIADQGGMTLEEVALITNLTRERIRQVQDHAVSVLRKTARGDMSLGAFTDGDEKPPRLMHIGRRSSRRKPDEPVEQEEESEDDADLTLADGDSVSFMSEHPKADHIVAAKTWRIYMRRSIEKGLSERKPTMREKKGLKPLPPLPDGEPLRNLKEFDVDADGQGMDHGPRRKT